MRLPTLFGDPTQTREFSAGATIFEPGQPGAEMFIVQSGEVDIQIGDQVVESVGPDGFFGELALIDNNPRSTRAVARTDCKLLPLDQHRFTFMVDEVPFFALRVMKVMADRLRRAASSQL